MNLDYEVVLFVPVYAPKKAKQWKRGVVANDKSTCTTDK